MKSVKTNLDEQCEKSTKPLIIYTAVGWVTGTFRPEGKKFKGVFVTEDGREIEAYLLTVRPFLSEVVTLG
jgi:hypothetical protein